VFQQNKRSTTKITTRNETPPSEGRSKRTLKGFYIFVLLIFVVVEGIASGILGKCVPYCALT